MNSKALWFSALSTVKNYDYCLIFLISFLYCHWYLLWSGTGFGVFLFTVLFCTMFSLRLDAAGIITQEHRIKARPWLFVVMLSAFASAWFDASTLGWFNFLFLSVAAVHWATVLAGRRFLPVVSAYLPLELFLGLITVPFANFSRFIGVVFRTKASRDAVAADHPMGPAPSDISEVSSRRESRRRILHNLLLICVTILFLGPLLLIVLNLLASADDEFMHMIARMIDGFFGFFSDAISFRMIETFTELLLAIPVACYLFGLLWALSRPELAKGWKTREQADHLISSLQFVPRIMIYTGLILFSGIYVLFLILQAVHLTDALTGGLPGSTTYADFARQGFFELCAVSSINLMIMAGSWLLCSRKQSDASSASASVPRPLRLLLAFLSLLTIFLVITAMAKMGLYIRAYGLTRLRVYTSWFMLWLLLVFILLTLATARKRGIAAESRLTPAKALTVLSIVMFLTLNYMNPDRIIVHENLSRYENSQMSLEELDLYGLASLSDDAALALLDYYHDHAEHPSGLRQQELLKELRIWLDRIDPSYRFAEAPHHRTVSSLRFQFGLERMKSL